MSTGDAEDVHFAVGEALCFAFGSLPIFPSDVLYSPFTSVTDHHHMRMSARTSDLDPPQAPAAPPPRELILSTALKNAGASAAHLRGAAAVWLLCLTTFCASAPEMHARLEAVQDALLGLLGDPSEITQVLLLFCKSPFCSRAWFLCLMTFCASAPWEAHLRLRRCCFGCVTSG